MRSMRQKRRRIEVINVWLRCNLRVVLVKIEKYRQDTRKLHLQAIIELIVLGLGQKKELITFRARVLGLNQHTHQ